MDTVVITALDQEGRGIARVDGKAVFVDDALIGERVRIEVYRRKPSYEQARMVELIESSPQRVTPPCPHFGVCGGCSLQHLEPSAQVATKQRVLEDALWHIGRVKPLQLMAPIHGPTWGYRQKARLSARHVAKKGGVLVGFHEKKSSYVADMTTCPVLPPNISAMLPELRVLIGRLSVRDRVPQIELAIGEPAAHDSHDIRASNDVLVLRNLAELTPADEAALLAFASDRGIAFYLQPEGPASVRPLHGPASPLHYALPDFGVDFEFEPTDFTQVNAAMNRVLVRRALGMLAPGAGEKVADFFCGLGNFTLPIASCGADVVGLEGNAALVRRAAANAARNRLAHRASFRTANLFEATGASVAALGWLDKALIDPPRDGAIALVKALPPEGLSTLVYVSCNPATLARDAGVLVNEHGYRFDAAGVANMFPHTAHVESLALFTR